MMEALKIHRAKPDEAQFLSDLAFRSKAHWPYDEDYLKLCRAAVHVTPQEIETWPFVCARLQGQTIGFASLAILDADEKMLDHLWVEPDYIGKGIGKVLFNAAVVGARNLGWHSFTIASDPYAEPFYKKMGAVRVGERESKIKPGFFLPLLEFQVQN